jgi:replicative DNA helicase
MSKIKGNIGVERVVLAGVAQYGKQAYFDITDIVNANIFSLDVNQALWRVFEKLFTQIDKPDATSILACADSLGLAEILTKNKVDIEYIRSLFNFPIEFANIRPHAKQLAKINIIHKEQLALYKAQQELSNFDGTESISKILGVGESSIFDLVNELNSRNEDAPKQIVVGAKERFEELAKSPLKNVGIPTLFPIYNKLIGGGVRPGVAVIGARPKALRYGSKVYSKLGASYIENVSIGDIIASNDGWTEVKEIFDYNNVDIYKISFRDGDYIECCKDHLWEVYKRYPYDLMQNKKCLIKSTQDLIGDICIGEDGRYKWDIKLPSPVEFNEQKIELDPYILGLLIGDGSLGNSIVIANHIDDVEIINYIKTHLDNPIKIDYEKGKCISYRINGLQPIIRKLGLFKRSAHAKFIPKHYIYNSIHTRLEILRGLMDTDGDCTIDKRSKNSRCRFATVSLQLAKDVQEIVNSLGGLCSINKTSTLCNNKRFSSFRCEIRLPKFNPFKLIRKKNKYSPRIIGELKRTISNIEKVGQDKARCIKVSSPDGLFLTNNCVITHNCGKSTICLNNAIHVAKLGIHTLILDSEMQKSEQEDRLVANVNQIPINLVETGQFTNHAGYSEKIYNSLEQYKDIKLYHKFTAGMSFEEILSVVRRWIYKEVGFDANGKTNPCFLLFDYFKITNEEDLGGLKEYEKIGYQISALSNFSKLYDIPVLAFIQLNRDALTRDGTDVISQSDRIVWLATSISIFKRLSQEEIAENGGHKNGNTRLVVLEARHGERLDDNDCILVNFDGRTATVKEIGTKYDILRKSRESGFEVVNEEN